ncbi:MAG: RNA-guided endonuclease TnpB family protein [Candidatus Micrarchaeaceae archaeon]
MTRTYKFRLYPSSEQKRLLDRQLNLCRELYNAFLEQRIIAHRMEKRINYNYQQDQIPELKKAFPEYNNIHSQVLQDVARRVDRAYENFFRRVKEIKHGKHQKAGFPRFKPMNRYRSITYPQSGFRIIEKGGLKLSKIGTIRMFMHRGIDGKIKTLTISRDRVGDWFASFSVGTAAHSENVEVPDQGGVGIDLGITHLAAMSDGTFIDRPHFLAKSEKLLKRDQRHLSRKKKGSNNRGKQKVKVAKRQRKVKRQREDFLHKVSNALVDSNSFLAFENLNIKGMVKNHHLAKRILDASWGMLVQYTSYKAESAGKVVVQVNPRNTSKACSRCGWLKDDLKLSDRIFHCNDCGLEIDRDLNAAINIHRLGMIKIGRGTPKFTPAEIRALPAMATQVAEAGSPRL